MSALWGTRLERVDVGGAELACLVGGEGPLVICAHGFPDCARSFRAQWPALAAAGYRVVLPFLRGYAPSTVARDGRYDAAALAADLCALRRHYSPSEPALLVGHDWGAVATYAAAALEPAAFARIATVAVPHLRVAAARFARPAQLARSWYIAWFQLRGIAERAVARRHFAFIDRLWRDWSPDFQPPVDELDAVKESIGAPENLRAALGYYRALASPAALFGESRRLLFARTRQPALYVHGARDGCIGVALAGAVEPAYSAGVEVHVLDGGHFVHQENPAAFNAILLRFLDGAGLRQKVAPPSAKSSS